MRTRGSLDGYGRVRRQLETLPTVLEPIAERAASEINRALLSSFDAGQTVYGGARPANKDGSARTLYRTGALRSGLRFVRTGTKLRCVLGVRYARYRVKDGVLPFGRRLPQAWDKAIAKVADDEIRRILGRV